MAKSHDYALYIAVGLFLVVVYFLTSTNPLLPAASTTT